MTAPAISQKMAKVSFVIPAYNEECLLPFTLEAIFSEIRQTDCSAEVIVIDDGSTDNTSIIAKKIGARVVCHANRYGLVAARMTGFREANGEIIANIDADTVVPKGWLKRVLNEFNCNSSLVCVSGPHFHNDLSFSVKLAVKIFYYIGYSFSLLNQFVFRTGALVQGGNFAVTRQAMAQAGRFSDGFKFYGEDTYLARRLIRFGYVKFSFALCQFCTLGRFIKQAFTYRGYFYYGSQICFEFFLGYLVAPALHKRMQRYPLKNKMKKKCTDRMTAYAQLQRMDFG